ncbi:hypothetical protein R9X47_00145 [Wukongibacter baidiensis]|uniref:hypothetical protein n=1 Tax=Wukongibacter baidiensis TaxID=1723361 RepID=UPI003D7FA556
MNKRISYLIFIIFSIAYVLIVEKYFYADENNLVIALGLFILIAGVWGKILNIVLIKLPLFSLQRYSKYINYSLIVIGSISLILGILKSIL